MKKCQKHIYGFAQDMDWCWLLEDTSMLDDPTTMKIFTFCPDCGENLIESENNGKKL